MLDAPEDNRGRSKRYAFEGFMEPRLNVGLNAVLCLEGCSKLRSRRIVGTWKAVVVLKMHPEKLITLRVCFCSC